MSPIPSVFLPRVSGYHDESYIEQVFWAYFGTPETPIARIDMIPKEDAKTGQMYAIAFVHFQPEMVETDEVSSFRAAMEKDDSVKLVHSYPWYWIIRKNTSSPSSRASRPRVLSEKDEADIKKAQQEYVDARKSSASEMPPPLKS
jgi:hypothetical protein